MDKEEANRLLFNAAINGGVSEARLALDAGADVNAKAELQETPLHWAVERRDSDLVKLLIERGADVNAKSTLANTPLHWAVEYAHLDIAKFLIEKGADINAPNTFDETPRQLAKSHGIANIVKLLEDAAKQQRGHAGRVTKERKDKGPPQVGG